MEENSENLSNENNVENLGESNGAENEEDLLKEAEIIAKLTQEAGFGGHDSLNGGLTDEEILNGKDMTESYTQDISQDNSLPEETKDKTSIETNVEETLEAEDTAPKAEEIREENLQEPEQPLKEAEETKEEIKEIPQPELPPEPEHFEELDNENSVVKKYIFYVSKDFVPLIDSMTQDERTGYINDAIQRKIDSEYEYKAIDKKKRLLTHIITMILTFFIVTPFMLFLVYKSIMITFDNYKYSQDNFERLYKERFKQDGPYKRALEYNERFNKEAKKEK